MFSENSYELFSKVKKGKNKKKKEKENFILKMIINFKIGKKLLQ